MRGHVFQNILKVFLIPFMAIFICQREGQTSYITIPKEGQMLVEAEAPEAGKWPLHVRIVLPVEAEPAVVWKVLTDYEHMAEFVPHMTKCKVIERQGNTVTVEEVFKHFLVSMELLLSVKESPPNRIDFRLVGGNMKVYDGRWSIEPHNPVGTLLTLEVAVQPGFYAPRSLVSWILKKSLPDGVLSIREKAVKDSGKTLPPGEVEVIP
ncbi:MAG TPA: SRPBCC family protein [Candidatus Brocadiales bacterium]|nr:SRPBCC family protein [Candidatus Brocadiales bacterium]